MKIVPARIILEGQSDSFPSNLAVDYLSTFNYFIEAFVTEESAKVDAYFEASEKALKRFKNLPDSNAYKKFALAETHFYRAIIKGKQNNLLSAAKDIASAHDYIEENATAFPEFIQNNKTRGIIKVYIAALPSNYQWATKLLGFSGDLKEGLNMLKSLAKSTDLSGELAYLSKETAYYYSFALYHVDHRPNTAWLETLKCTSDYETNNMSAFFRSNMALKIRKNEMAIKCLSSRPRYDDYLPFYFLDYQLGLAKLNRMDIDAIELLLNFKNNYKGNSYVKSCHQKISWYYLLAGDFELADYYQNEIKEVGQLLTEDDKQAENYASKIKPNRILLKARLQCDGGYYTDALTTIKKTSTKVLSNDNERAEYCYRKGKIFEHLGEKEVAVKFYEACRIYGKTSPEYYGAYACLYLGDYYLSQEDFTSAEKYYSLALDFPENKEYVESIEQRAKAGLKKLK